MKIKKDTRRTLIIFGLGFLTAVLGFFYLWRGFLTVAPILIVGGYLIMIISLSPLKREE